MKKIAANKNLKKTYVYINVSLRLIMVFYREAIAVFSSAGRGAKRKIQLNAKAFSWRLRISASVCG